MRRIVLALAILLATTVSVQADTIIQWTFEPTGVGTNPPDLNGSTTSPTAAATTGTGSAIGVHAGSANWTTPAGNGSTDSFSVTNWAVGDYWQFSTATTGYQDISLSWDQTSSNTGPRDFQLQYSTNGTTFTNFGSVYAVLANAAPNPVWNASTNSPLYNFSVSLSGVTALNDASTVFFRLADASTVSANGTTVASGGTSRVDTFTVTGTLEASGVPEPNSLLFSSLAFGGVTLVRRRHKAAARD